MARLLKEKYKTVEGAVKRCGFENGVAKGEYERGETAKHYRYAVVPDPYYPDTWRVERS